MVLPHGPGQQTNWGHIPQRKVPAPLLEADAREQSPGLGSRGTRSVERWELGKGRVVPKTKGSAKMGVGEVLLADNW